MFSEARVDFSVQVISSEELLQFCFLPQLYIFTAFTTNSKKEGKDLDLWYGNNWWEFHFQWLWD